MRSKSDRRFVRQTPRRCVATLLAATACLALVPQTALGKAPRYADGCKDARKPFNKIKDFQANRILEGALLGALLGAGVGLLGNSGGNKSSILPEMLAGAAAGGAAGYLGSIAQDQRNKDELRAAIAQDFAPTMTLYSQLPDQLRALGQCRRNQIAQVESDMASGAIARVDADKRLTLIETWVAQDDTLIAKASGVQAQTVTTFAQANAVADGVDPQQAQQEGFASTYYGLDAVGAQIDVANQQMVQRQFVNAASGARLRAAPSANGPVLAMLAHGSAVETVGYAADGWVQVRTANGQSGYISSSLIQGGAPKKPAPAMAISPAKARVIKAGALQRDFAAAQRQEKSATAARLAAARSLLAGA